MQVLLMRAGTARPPDAPPTQRGGRTPMSRDTFFPHAIMLHGADWTARRIWWASLLTAAASLLPLVVAGARLAPCLLGMRTSIFRASAVPGAVPGAGVVDRAAVSGSSTFACAW